MHADAAPVQPLAAPCVALFALLMPHKRAPRSQMAAVFSERRMEKSSDRLADLDKDARVLSIKEQLPCLDKPCRAGRADRDSPV